MRALPIHMYADVMREIKRRTEVAHYFMRGPGNALYYPTTLESICLQIRKILELIAMASLVANKRECEKIHSNFQRHWNAELLLKDLERANPDFYPRPILEKPSSRPGVKSDFEDVVHGVLTKREFIKAYRKCGALLHADNPLGTKSNYNYYEKALPEWLDQIVKLLDSHSVKLKGHGGFWLIHMKEARDEEVRYYEFAIIEKVGSQPVKGTRALRAGTC